MSTCRRESPITADRVALETSSGLDVVERILQTLDGVWSRHGEVPDAIRVNVATAAAEVGGNIVQHAAREWAVQIRMEVAVVDDRVHVDFTDDGLPADIDLSAVSMPDEWVESGRGLALAVGMLSELSYRRSGDTNYWALISGRFGDAS